MFYYLKKIMMTDNSQAEATAQETQETQETQPITDENPL
jgi:hypothetical protein